MTALPNAMRVDAICTVLKADYMKNGGIGEAHDFPELSYIAKGALLSVRDGEERLRREGDLVLIAPGSFHKKKEPSESEGWIISFSSSSEMLSALYNRPILLNAEERAELASVFSLGLRCFEKKPKGAIPAGMVLSAEADLYMVESFKKRLELFLLGLYHRYAEENGAHRTEKNEFYRVCRVLSEHIEEPLSLEEIARLSEICLSKLKALFREKGGVNHYFTRLKIERAKRLMLEGRMNFSEIAAALGFSSLHYFSRTFKGVTGISPSQFLRIS